MRNEQDYMIFLDMCLKSKKNTHLQAVFDLFFTIEEKENIASRMKIIRTLLDKKLSQRAISETMQVSISQITRGSNALKVIDDDLLTFIDNHVQAYNHE